MTETQVTYWRDLPSMVVARHDGESTKSLLAPRFQEAIDEAAMRMGDTGADDYLAGWRRGEWTPSDEAPDVALERLSAGLDGAWPDDRVAAYLDELGASS